MFAQGVYSPPYHLPPKPACMLVPIRHDDDAMMCHATSRGRFPGIMCPRFVDKLEPPVGRQSFRRHLFRRVVAVALLSMIMAFSLLDMDALRSSSFVFVVEGSGNRLVVFVPFLKAIRANDWCGKSPSNDLSDCHAHNVNAWSWKECHDARMQSRWRQSD